MTDHDDTYDEDAHADHASENPRWVLLPLVVGMVIGLVVVLAFGLDAEALPFV